MQFCCLRKGDSMAYTEILESDLEVGQPIKQSLFTTIKDNFIDHESRIDNLEQGAGKIIVADFEVIGYISHYLPSELRAIATHRAPCNYNLLEFIVTIMDSANGFDQSTPPNPIATGTSGVLSLVLKKSTDGGITYNSIMTVEPAIPVGYNGKGTSSISTGCIEAVFSDTQIYQDDLLRLDVTSLKDIQGTFSISIYGSLD